MNNDPVNSVDPLGLDGDGISVSTCVGNICFSPSGPTVTIGIPTNNPLQGGFGGFGIHDPLLAVDTETPQNANSAGNLANDPCDSSMHAAAIQSDLSQIATTIGGKLDAKWNIQTPRGLTVETAVGRLENSGFEQFHSYNPEHPGVNLQGQLNGRWYHVTVSPVRAPNAAVNANQSGSGPNAARNSPSNNSPSRINKVTAHCEKNEPDSAAHFWDYLKSFIW